MDGTYNQTQLLQYFRGKRKFFSFERLLLQLPELTQQQAEQLEMPELFTMLLPSVNMDKNFLSKWRLKKSVLLAEPYLATSNPSLGIIATHCYCLCLCYHWCLCFPCFFNRQIA